MARKVCPSFHAAWYSRAGCEAKNDKHVLRLVRVDQMINVHPYSGSLNQMVFSEMLFSLMSGAYYLLDTHKGFAILDILSWVQS